MASSPVTTRAEIRPGVQRTVGGSTHQNVDRPRTAAVAICVSGQRLEAQLRGELAEQR